MYFIRRICSLYKISNEFLDLLMKRKRDYYGKQKKEKEEK